MPESDTPAHDPAHEPWWRRRAVKITGGIFAGLLVAALIGVEYFLHHLAPIVRTRVIQTLSESFNSPVELDSLDISLFRGIEVNGYGLRIPYGIPPNDDPQRKTGPLLSVEHFRFRTTFKGLLRRTTHLDEVRAQGVEIHIPPHDQRMLLLGTREGLLPADPTRPRIHPRIAFTVSRVVDQDIKLFIETDKPGKEALEFDIRRLQLDNLGPDVAATYSADLTNAKPRGEIHATGHLGPWASDDPRETPVDGDFTFTNADMNTIKGLGGTLQGSGRYSGKLDSMIVDGRADVPNFSLDTAHHPVPLTTRYHAFVDGTTGDTTRAPVNARLGRSDFTTSGKVAKTPTGHDIALDVEIPDGQVADFLRLSMETSPPLMSGNLTMKARLHVPPGPERVPTKLGLTGQFTIRGVRFNNVDFQNKVDGLSARAQGHPEEAKAVSTDAKAETDSQMSASIVIGHGQLTATDVHYAIPGAVVLLNGAYSMNGSLYEFKGHVRTEATASQMVGGWKGLLLKPLDHFLKKDGAGLQLPIEITGTGSHFHFGLAMNGGAEESPADMAKDLRQNHSQRLNEAKRSRQEQDGDSAKKAAKEREKRDEAERRAQRDISRHSS